MNRYVLLINGAVSGSRGSTAILLGELARWLEPQVSVKWLDLAQTQGVADWESMLEGCAGLVFGTGTYWDSWGSPLQRFLEQMTYSEGTSLWLGKPAAIVVTMHSVGGKAVLSRLQGVLNTLGVLLPPMSGLVYSAVTHATLGGSSLSVLEKSQPSDLSVAADTQRILDDLWRIEDLTIVAHNLLQALQGTTNWKSWPVDRDGVSRRWLEVGPAGSTPIPTHKH